VEDRTNTYIKIGETSNNGRGYTILECSLCSSKKEVRNDAYKNNSFSECHCIEKTKYIGMVYGKLKIIDIYNGSEFLCECQCKDKTIKKVKKKLLKNGHVKSCGCLPTGNGGTHHLSNTRLYNIWTKMKQRCYNKNNKDYIHYGNRSIIVCDEWRNDFVIFYNWAILNGYEKTLTIERLNVNENYEPLNCTWIPNEKQADNKTTTNFVIYNNEKFNVTQLANKLNKNRNQIYKMLRTNIIKHAE